MKRTLLLLTGVLGLVLAGCSTPQGGAETNESATTTATGYGYGYGQGTAPAPMAPPTFRPGLNPMDIRDPQSLTFPEPPTTTPPTVPPQSLPAPQ